jgi:pSer/pThr/pTyr-binding forkhead associated (FHA) protein
VVTRSTDPAVTAKDTAGLSLYGTYVNRELVESATLANGDKIYIGRFCLVVLKSRND